MVGGPLLNPFFFANRASGGLKIANAQRTLPY